MGGYQTTIVDIDQRNFDELRKHLFSEHSHGVWFVQKEGPVTLVERQANFVYESSRVASRYARSHIVPLPWEEREEPFKAQFLDIIKQQMSNDRFHSPEKLHESWIEAYTIMGWAYGATYDIQQKTHPDLVSYNKLRRLEKNKDDIFLALCDIARKYID